jgi:hypothetical protein
LYSPSAAITASLADLNCAFSEGSAMSLKASTTAVLKNSMLPSICSSAISV